MKYLLDTNACIRYLNGKSELLRDRIDVTGDEQIVVCSIVEAELFFGAAKSSDPLKTLERQRRFLARFGSLPFDSLAAETYGPVRAAIEAAGTPIGAHDLLIATIALSRQLTVVTANTAEFIRIPRSTDRELGSGCNGSELTYGNMCLLLHSIEQLVQYVGLLLVPILAERFPERDQTNSSGPV